MGWCNYLVVPKIKALYDVYHSPLEKEFYGDVYTDLENLEQVVSENSDIVSAAREEPLKNLSVKAINSLYKIYDALPPISGYDKRVNIFVAYMLKFHKDAYLVNENDKKIAELKTSGYKIFSSVE